MRVENPKKFPDMEVNMGRPIFGEGDVADQAYFIKKGQVAIYKNSDHGQILLRTLSEGSLFGEFALIDTAPRSASAVAKSPVTLIPISRDIFTRELEAVDPFMRKVIRMLVNDLRDTTDAAVRKAAKLAQPVKPVNAEG